MKVEIEIDWSPVPYGYIPTRLDEHGYLHSESVVEDGWRVLEPDEDVIQGDLVSYYEGGELDWLKAAVNGRKAMTALQYAAYVQSVLGQDFFIKRRTEPVEASESGRREKWEEIANAFRVLSTINWEYVAKMVEEEKDADND